MNLGVMGGKGGMLALGFSSHVIDGEKGVPFTVIEDATRHLYVLYIFLYYRGMIQFFT